MNRVLSILSIMTITAAAQPLGMAADDGSASAKLPTGTWSSPCVAFGQQAVCRTEWSPGLHGVAMIVQSYRIESADEGRLLFEGRGLYRVDGAVVTGFWEDSGGSLYEISGSWNDRVIDVYWGELGDGGRSQYDFSSGKLRATDWILRQSGWIQFMQVDYGVPRDTS